EFMNLDVRFADTEVVGFVHGRLSEGLAAFAAAVGCGRDPTGAFSGAVELLLGGEGSFFRTTGSVVNRTMTSSSFSKLAEGFTRICVYCPPGLTCVMMPTGRSLGKMRSMPLVTTREPTATSSSLPTYFMFSSGSPVPPTGL